MKQTIMIILAAIALLGSQIACCTITLPQLPEININVPTVEVGDVQDVRESIPLAGAESTTVEIKFGAGELDIEAGTSDELFAGHFRYNVERWAPEVRYENDVLSIEQGGTDNDWGVPTGSVRNEWALEFTPEIPLTMDLDIGAGDGEMDLTGMQLAQLDIDMGAGDLKIRFDEPNEAQMSRLTLDSGASKLDVVGIGHAGPEEMRVQGGAGNIRLDFTGAWPRSCEARVTAGVGSLTLRLPDDVGVRVETEGGLTNVNASGLRRAGDAYVNDAFGEAEIELHVQITAGVGSIQLIEVSND